MIQLGRHELHNADCREALRAMPDDSVDAVCTDPPYGLGKAPDIAAVLTDWLAGAEHRINGGGFMGKSWDAFVPGPDIWREVVRVLKPGGHAVVFAGQRTIDLMGISLRLGGFEIRESGAWMFYSGFPKSLDISKAIDAHLGHEREVVGVGGVRCADLAAGRPCSHASRDERSQTSGTVHTLKTAPASPEAKRWEGFGTATKPALEPFILCRKPLSESSIARNVLRWGTGGINIDGCRYAYGDPAWPGPGGDPGPVTQGCGGERTSWKVKNTPRVYDNTRGRFPANIYACPKASTAEREQGCERLRRRTAGELTGGRAEGSDGLQSPRAGAGRTSGGRGNHHPTVKPLRLIRWLSRLVTPPGGIVLDPFVGSGTTLLACEYEGFTCLAIEREAEYCEIARARFHGHTDGDLFLGAVT